MHAERIWKRMEPWLTLARKHAQSEANLDLKESARNYVIVESGK